jgi:predicted RNA-binding protein YlxR (DUF448 family)
MTRGGHSQSRTEPERRCILTGARGPAAAMIRFVVAPDGAVVPDILGRLPGRGMWLSAAPDHVERAARKGLFARAARRPVRVPDDLAATVEAQLAARVIALLAMARKAGAALAGFEKVRAALAADDVAALIQARDGSPREKSRLRPPPGAARIEALAAQEIGLAFGRGYVIHAALKTGGLAPRILAEAGRLDALRGTGPSPAAEMDDGGPFGRCGDA